MNGFSFGASSAVIEGKLTAFEIAPRQQIVRHLLGDLQRDVLLRLGGGGAEMRRADHVRMAEQHVGGGRLLDEHVERRARDLLRNSSASPSACSSTSPPRAQLMMRTPFFILASAAASMMLRVFSVSGVCSVMKSARLKQLVELDLLDADVLGALRRQERIEGDHLHAQAERAVGDDRADIAAADHAQRLAGDLDAHEAVLLPLAGLGRGIGLRNFAAPAPASG